MATRVIRMMKRESAIRAAMTYDWSNGQVEGNVNRLKMIKRMMFGRQALLCYGRESFTHPDESKNSRVTLARLCPSPQNAYPILYSFS
jgi:hypothetical protein